jgi:DNA-binding transcriptional regulator YiaG
MGFPVVLHNVTMLWIQDDWVPDIDYNRLHAAAAHVLAFKPDRLTGAEVRFLRQLWEMTYQKFADLFAVRAQTVMKWEKIGQHPTKMVWTTEKDLRLTILDRLKIDKGEFQKAFQLLRNERPSPKRRARHTIDLKKAANPRRVLATLLKQQSPGA